MNIKSLIENVYNAGRLAERLDREITDNERMLVTYGFIPATVNGGINE